MSSWAFAIVEAKFNVKAIEQSTGRQFKVQGEERPGMCL